MARGDPADGRVVGANARKLNIIAPGGKIDTGDFRMLQNKAGCAWIVGERTQNSVAAPPVDHAGGGEQISVQVPVEVSGGFNGGLMGRQVVGIEQQQHSSFIQHEIIEMRCGVFCNNK